MAEANGWQRLLTNSAKLVNIIGGYGYKPTLASMRALHRQRRRGKDRVMPIVLRCHRGIGPAVTGTALVAEDNFIRPLRSRPAERRSSRGRRTSSPARAMSAGSWC